MTLAQPGSHLLSLPRDPCSQPLLLKLAGGTLVGQKPDQQRVSPQCPTLRSNLTPWVFLRSPGLSSVETLRADDISSGREPSSEDPELFGFSK